VDAVIVVVTDLFFQARISAAARVAGRNVHFVTAGDRLPVTIAGETVLIDLDAALDVTAAIARLREGGAGQIIAFGPHVDTDRRKAARAAGADRVLAKSRFVTELPAILGGAGARPRS
jgi:CheY-like chemotaxis protein